MKQWLEGMDMTAKVNGNLKWIISVLVLAAGIVATAAVLSSDVEEMKPDVKLNNQHRMEDEVSDRFIREKITDIETFAVDGGGGAWLFCAVRTDEGITGWGEFGMGAYPQALLGLVRARQ